MKTIKRAITPAVDPSLYRLLLRAFTWEIESENRQINIINFGFLSLISKWFKSIELTLSLSLLQKMAIKTSVRVNVAFIYTCARIDSILVFIPQYCSCFHILICFTSNTIFVQFIMTRCLFCFNKLPQNEFNHNLFNFKYNHFGWLIHRHMQWINSAHREYFGYISAQKNK